MSKNLSPQTDRKTNKDATVILLPESEGQTLCFEFRGLINAEDYKVFSKNVAKTVAKYGTFNLLIYYSPSYKGWEPKAADQNMRDILEFAQLVSRRAYINPPEKKMQQHLLTPNLFGGVYKYFSTAQMAKAMEWVKDSETGTGSASPFSKVNVLPQTRDNIICFESYGLIHNEGFEIISSHFDEMLKKHRSVRLLAWFKTYKGWEKDAVATDMDFTLKYGKKIEKIALINPPEKFIFLMKSKADLMPAKTKYFSEEEFEDAFSWIES